MKAYGSENQRYFYRDEEFGPATKYRPRCKDRTEWRRLLHKKGRNNGIKEVRLQSLEDSDVK
jgi:hypothetical protein